MRNLKWIAVAMLAGVVCLAIGVASSTAADKELDSVRLKAKPDNIPTKIAAVANSSGQIFITISVKKKGKYVELGRDQAPGVNVSDGNVAIEASQEGGGYSKNGGQGLLGVGDEFAEYFGWNAKRGKIAFF